MLDDIRQRKDYLDLKKDCEETLKIGWFTSLHEVRKELKDIYGDIKYVKKYWYCCWKTRERLESRTEPATINWLVDIDEGEALFQDDLLSLIEDIEGNCRYGTGYKPSITGRIL